MIRIDVTDGIVTGEGAEYTFVLPKSWQIGAVTVNRERPAGAAQFLDKIIFMYRPVDRISMPTTFAILYVYENRPNFTLQPPGARKILETDSYVFVFESTTRNNFRDTVDRMTLDILITSAASDSAMAEQIAVPRSQRITPTSTVTVNGRLLRSQAVRRAGGAIYIPLREAGNALGYAVVWSAATNDVTLYAIEHRHVVSINLSPAAQRYPVIIIDDRAFVSSVFFMRELNVNIEIDGNNNVIITSVT
jgi:hypothetical protein